MQGQSACFAASQPTTPSATRSVAPPLGAEDQARADLYALAARLLLAPPDAALLADLAAADPILGSHDERPLEDAWEQLVLAAAVVDAAAVAEEFDGLFISLGTPPVNPYGSLYLSGFLNDTPLAQLRADLAALGLARVAGVAEFEDHLGALCETMRVLILSGRPLARQQEFFEAHLGPWFARCLEDVAQGPGANFYRVVAAFVAAFLTIEAQAFAVDSTADAALA
ncbi:TorD/DmsD family molecular chaperone [Pseudoduganella chitinolytica]|uniref:Molecular chaperone TorD family protein n=1 Tax=Pseudoduganella chitinolytica TaxID=34070 RepID=A0ABY8BKA0_9BURK|nr:molecular chaperone TorD family protein [Pseudoduganella chitinolytica]WEF35331.1 molecular chaperone TorD family protein [Pseudoduganella chitinolytica]